MFPKFVKGKKEEQNFAACVEAYKKNQLIPYVGAGFSMHSSACPSWYSFLRKLCDEHKGDMLPEELEAFEQAMADYDYETALDGLVEVIGKPQFFRQVEQAFDKPKNGQGPDDFANKFELFHKVFKGPWLTTNLDRFIEGTCPKSAAHITAIEGYKDARFGEDLNRGDLDGYLFKLHGDAKSRQSLVFAGQQYVEAYGDDTTFDLSEKLPALLARVYRNYSLLFMGCSLSIDRPLMILEHLAAEGGVKPQFALLLRKHFTGDDNLDKRRQLKRLDITPIYLDSFDDIELMFEALSPETDADCEADLIVPDVFVGRESQLQTLLASVEQAGSVLTITENTPILNHIQGHGGIGKTTLARQVLHQCGHLFDGCFEIRIDSMGPEAFAKALAAKLGNKGVEFNTVESAESYIAQKLNERRLLLLLDNVDEGKVLLELLPQSYQSCIIATSRDNELADLIELKRGQLQLCAIELEKFSVSEALALFKQLLKKRYQTGDEATYLAIAEQVGYLPIALRLAITTMVFGDRLTAKELLAKLESNPHSLLNEQATQLDINDQERSILAVFDLSTPLLTESLTYALALIAVCEQGPVPEDFLLALHQQMAATDSLDFELDEQQLISHLRLLERYSWCKRITLDEQNEEQHYYEQHQIVRQVVTNELIDCKLQAMKIEAKFVDTVQQHFITEPLHFTVLDRWINQTDKAVLWLKDNQDRRLIYWISGSFGEFCSNRGYGERLVRYCQWLRQVFVDDKRNIAISLGCQALILSSKGQLDEALVLHQQEQGICEGLGDKVALCMCYGNQAVILASQGRLDEALELHQLEQEICVEFGDKAGLSATYSNQALILQRKGQWDEALALHKREQRIKEALGDRAGLARTYGNQATILVKKGQFDKALSLHLLEQETEEGLGNKVGLAICYANQSLIFAHWQDWSQALTLIQHAIELHRECGIPTDKWEARLAKWQNALDEGK